ncbi:P-loop containing nucleoside triphosphate hydrolase protein, partial [Gautieria morchelliformis]
VVSIALLNDPSIGKTLLMGKYIGAPCPNSGTLSCHHYITLISCITPIPSRVTSTLNTLPGWEVTISLFKMAVPAHAPVLIFVFDLTRQSTLNGIREWHQHATMHNQMTMWILVGNKYDRFRTLPPEQQEQMIHKAKCFARAMHCPLMFCSVLTSLNVHVIFEILLVKVQSISFYACTVSITTHPVTYYKGSTLTM